jgi:CRISPR/Cas system-associated exonuclease Cas4 (RecB family)
MTDQEKKNQAAGNTPRRIWIHVDKNRKLTWDWFIPADISNRNMWTDGQIMEAVPIEIYLQDMQEYAVSLSAHLKLQNHLALTELQSQVQHWKKYGETTYAELKKACDERDELKAENERLREAIDKIMPEWKSIQEAGLYDPDASKKKPHIFVEIGKEELDKLRADLANAQAEIETLKNTVSYWQKIHSEMVDNAITEREQNKRVVDDLAVAVEGLKRIACYHISSEATIAHEYLAKIQR